MREGFISRDECHEANKQAALAKSEELISIVIAYEDVLSKKEVVPNTNCHLNCSQGLWHLAQVERAFPGDQAGSR